MKKVFLISLICIVLVLTIPVLLSSLMTFEVFSKSLGSADGWLGYWGGYFGALLGLAAVIIATQLQIKSQNKNHKLQLAAQKISIDKTAKINDSQERDRIYSSFLLKQNEELMELVIELNDLNTIWFNQLRDYARYELNIQKAKDYKDKMLKSEILLLVKVKKLTNDEIDSIVKSNTSSIDNVKDQETEIRIKILSISAKIKSKSMYFSDFEQEIDKYRASLDQSLGEYYSHIEKKDIEIDEFIKKIEETSTYFNKSTNLIMHICHRNMMSLLNILRTH